LRNKDLLHDLYVNQRLSATQVSEVLGVSRDAVYGSLHRKGIPVRAFTFNANRKINYVKGMRANRPSFIFDEDVISGSLLGDAWLIKANRLSHNSWPSFHKRNKYRPHIEYVANQLIGDNWSERVFPAPILYKNKELTYWFFSSCARVELSNLFPLWYPQSNDFKKVVPPHLILTPKMILHWFLDDGSTSYRKRDAERKGHRKKEYYATQVVMSLSSESFVKEDQKRLAQQLHDNFGIRTRLQRVQFGTGWRIGVLQSSIHRFFDVIGPCPEELKSCMGYKWKFPVPGKR
jgi:hypothetical protein